MTARAVVFGEALVDRFSSGDVPGGAPFNVARHLAAFGAAPAFVSRVGDDAPGALLRAEAQRFGLPDATLQTDAAWPTGLVQVLQPGDGTHRFEIAAQSAYDRIDADTALAALPGLAASGAFYYGTLALRDAVSRSAWRALLARSGGLRLLDLNWRDGHVSVDTALAAMRACHWLKVNDAELAMVLGWLDSLGPGDADQAAAQTGNNGDMGNDQPHISAARVQRLMQATGVQCLVVTFGAKGYAAYGAQGQCLAAGSAVQQAALADTVGAGDAFSAVMLLGHLHGWALADTLERANAFAAFICTQRGAVPAELQAYDDWRRRWGIA
ncbi:MAG: fructokinase [Betaproteobacteria bacterium]|nr:fructokinase [Betaproteobacteria bacterium]